MNEIINKKMLVEIMAVKNEILFSDYVRKNFVYDAKEYDFENIILNNYEFLVRGPLETNFNYKQIVTYAIVVDTKNRVFLYKRGGKNSNAGDNRLHEKYSLGVGGHLEKTDVLSKNILKDALMRELFEEIQLKSEDIISLEALGYINNDDDEVSEVHLGVSFLIKVSENFDPKMEDGELDSGFFVSLGELENIFGDEKKDIEAWSRLLFPVLLKRLEKNS